MYMPLIVAVLHVTPVLNSYFEKLLHCSLAKYIRKINNLDVCITGKLFLAVLPWFWNIRSAR